METKKKNENCGLQLEDEAPSLLPTSRRRPSVPVSQVSSVKTTNAAKILEFFSHPDFTFDTRIYIVKHNFFGSFERHDYLHFLSDFKMIVHLIKPHISPQIYKMNKTLQYHSVEIQNFSATHYGTFFKIRF